MWVSIEAARHKVPQAILEGRWYGSPLKGDPRALGILARGPQSAEAHVLHLVRDSTPENSEEGAGHREDMALIWLPLGIEPSPWRGLVGLK